MTQRQRTAEDSFLDVLGRGRGLNDVVTMRDLLAATERAAARHAAALQSEMRELCRERDALVVTNGTLNDEAEELKQMLERGQCALASMRRDRDAGLY